MLGLKWDAIDFENKTITIRHTVHEVTVDGKTKIVASDTTKTKSSYRSLPLVKPFEEILLKMKREQEENKRLCGRCYCQDYLDYIYVNQIGEIVKPGFVTAHFSAVLKANNLPHIRFHDLRHPYVKHTTKNYSCKSRNPKLPMPTDSLGFLFYFSFYNLASNAWCAIATVFLKNTSVVVPHSSR